ncbi:MULTISPECIES: hypothetical protein [unclassified Chryseobacterium]|uniref:hypothetical protein n=1 Tax=unclassified Chryseobacterium TaxID=2593645 RepID=UPI000D70C246|nr:MULTISPECIES: hypothetical protein [unclassified Chryseobacterium]PWW20127.1 hypothetical protein DEU40_11525 [Chryseobacterium sp. AG844]
MKKQYLKFPVLLQYLSVIQFIVVLLICLKGNQPLNTIYFISILSLFVISILLFSKLTIIITDDNMKYSFFPFLPFFKTIKKNEIKKAYIGNANDFYSMIGWGIRYSKKYGVGYILDSEKVIYIELITGKKVILSIKNENDFSSYLK